MRTYEKSVNSFLVHGFTPFQILRHFLIIVCNLRRKDSLKICDTYKKFGTGFTLVELLLVVVIIGALVAMVMPRLAGRSDQARVAAAQADISANISTALKLYELDNGVYPTSEEGLQALLSKSSSAINWNGPYLERKPIDPWGRVYQYKSPGDNRTYGYDLYSLGRDGQESSDDVTNWD